MNQFISIIIPMYNAENSIVEVLDSILANKDLNYEVIIVDDDSKDKSVSKVKTYLSNNIKLVKLNKNKGAAFARNKGFEFAKGELIMFLDADNIIPSNTLELFRKGKTDIVNAIYSSESYFKNYASKYKNAFLEFVHRNKKLFFWSGCSCVKRNILEIILFNEKIRGAQAEDTEFGLRYEELGFTSSVNKNIRIKHKHKHSILSVLRNDFEKAKCIPSLKKDYLIKTYIDFKLWISLINYFPMLVLAHIFAGIGYLIGSISNPYFKFTFRIFKKNNPVQLTLFPTNRCNANCPHCLNSALNTGKDMSFELIEKISSSMPDFAYLLISGGEPFLRNDLAEIINQFYVNNNVQNVVVATNGFLSSKIVDETKEILKKYRNHLAINVSIDSIGEEHDMLRRQKNSYDNAIKTIKKLQELKHKNLDIGIIMTMTKKNEDSLLKTYTELKKLKVNSISLNLVRGKPNLIPSMKKYYSLIKLMEEDNKDYEKFAFSSLNKSIKKTMRELIKKTSEKGYQSPCFAGRLNVIITNDGLVYPCEMLNKPFGDLNKNSFSEIWDGSEAKKIRTWIKKTKCHCTEECNVNMNILYNPKYYFKLIKRL